MIGANYCNIALAAGSGGPYGQVRPGFVEIARSTNALVVPIIIRGRGVMEFKHPLRHFIARPFCSLVVYTATPLDGLATNTTECQRALDELEKQATHGQLDDRE